MSWREARLFANIGTRSNRREPNEPVFRKTPRSKVAASVKRRKITFSAPKNPCLERSDSGTPNPWEAGELSDSLSSFLDRYEVALVRAFVNLARPGDLLLRIEQHLLPMGHPA